MPALSPIKDILAKLFATILGPSRRRQAGRAGCPTLAQTPEAWPLVPSGTSGGPPLPAPETRPAPADDDDVVVVDLGLFRRIRLEVQPPLGRSPGAG